jgi:hypothetical protein
MRSNLAYSDPAASITQTTSAKVVQLRPSNSVQATSEAIPPRYESAAWRKVCALVNLPEDWDGYGSPRIDRQVGMFALEVLNKIMAPETPEPYIVPSPAGGVQIEWHRNHVDLEMHIVAPYEVQTFVFDHASGEEQEFTLSDNVAAVATIIDRISG